MQAGRSILYLVTEDWYFCLHRLPIARAARDAGYTVYIAARVKDHGQVLQDEGFHVIPLDWRRESRNPLRAVLEISRIIGIYRRYRPDIVHHVALKPSLYGSIAAVVALRAPVVNNLAGLGRGFADSGMVSSAVSGVLKTAIRRLFRRKRSVTIVENADDRDFLVSQVGLPGKAVILIRGIGVDEVRFACTEEQAVAAGQPVTITLVSRLLWPKGVGELVEAGRRLRAHGLPVTIQIVGMPDVTSGQAVPAATLEQWAAEGAVEWLGHRDDIPEIWRQSHIAVLPSYYREGIPRSLMEAAACGRPVVTTDMPGCREVVKEGVSGYLVTPRDVEALTATLEKLVRDPALRQRMGRKGRELIERDLTEAYVVEQTMDVYSRLMTQTNMPA